MGDLGDPLGLLTRGGLPAGDEALELGPSTPQNI